MNLDSTLKMIRSLHRSTQNPSMDDWIKLCEDVAGLIMKTPDQEAVRLELFEAVVQRLVVEHDSKVLSADIASLDVDQRAAFYTLYAMAEDDLHPLCEGQPQLREQIARTIWERDQHKRLTEELQRLSQQLIASNSVE